MKQEEVQRIREEVEGLRRLLHQAETYLAEAEDRSRHTIDHAAYRKYGVDEIRIFGGDGGKMDDYNIEVQHGTLAGRVASQLPQGFHPSEFIVAMNEAIAIEEENEVKAEAERKAAFEKRKAAEAKRKQSVGYRLASLRNRIARELGM